MRGMPGPDPCLELELRMFGDQTVGVWGALGEDDRRVSASLPTAAAPTRRHRRGVSGDDGFTVTGGQVVVVLAVLLVVVLVAVAGRVLLAAAVIVGAQWAVITYWPENTTLVWVVLAVPALLAGYTLADALTGSTGLGSARVAAGGPAMSAHDGWLLISVGIASMLMGIAMSGDAAARVIDAQDPDAPLAVRRETGGGADAAPRR